MLSDLGPVAPVGPQRLPMRAAASQRMRSLWRAWAPSVDYRDDLHPSYCSRNLSTMSPNTSSQPLRSKQGGGAREEKCVHAVATQWGRG